VAAAQELLLLLLLQLPRVRGCQQWHPRLRLAAEEGLGQVPRQAALQWQRSQQQ